MQGVLTSPLLSLIAERQLAEALDLEAIQGEHNLSGESIYKLLNDHGIEVGPGLGPLAGQVWRIGLMGHSSNKENVDLVLAALKKLL